MDYCIIRMATPAEADRILEIYAPYVTDTAITFEYEAPSIAIFRKRMQGILEKYPYLVAERDGQIVGYTYAHAFHERAAYDWSAETTIYVRMDQKGQGIGKALYLALEHALSLQNIINLNACIGYPETEDAYLTRDSVRFHMHFGYRWVGEFHQCGYKFGRWYHMVWMEKMLGEHPQHPLPVRRFQEIRAALADQYGIL